MARFSDDGRDRIDDAVRQWTERSLLADRSLLFEGREDVWTLAHAEDLYDRFVGKPLEGKDTFEEKWRHQMEDAPEAVRILAAEILLVHFWFAASIRPAHKRAVSAVSLEGTELALPDDAIAVRALDQQIGNPGIGFNTRRDLQVGYLIDFVKRWKVLEPTRQRELLGDPWALRDFADKTSRDVREMRHVLLHLLAPEHFERISSGSHKGQIAAAFAGVLDPDGPEDLDERLYAIRQKLEEYLPEGNTRTKMVDFYHPPLRNVWYVDDRAGDGLADLDALLWKKQLILYGPPGTSKSHRARELATTLIRREAMRRWGPKAFFEHKALLDEHLDGPSPHYVVWLQLHPAYGYEEFVRGLVLEDGRTRYKPGLLFEVIRRVHEQPLPQGLERLPVVLVLDEINRTDMSRMLGEAFSLLEPGMRGRELLLPGFDDDEEPLRLAIPQDLYVIGTMNEIDQSVETLDFALRRRFLWSECPFERETLLAIIRERWPEDMPSAKFRLEDAAEDLEAFADRAVALNKAIADSPELGRQYQVGHTYFADITFFLGGCLRGRNRPPKGTYLWDGKRPRPPLTDLWRRSLRPLLEQYLAGSDTREEELKRLSDTFHAR